MRYLQVFPLMLFCFSAVAQEAKDSGASENAPSGITSVTGFYGGADLGLDLLKMKSRDQRTNSQKNKTKSSALLDAFAGYNVQLGKFIFGLEGFLDFRTATPKTDISSRTYSLKRKYGFGISPKIGYNIYNTLNGYVNFGTLTSKYKVRGNDEKSNPTKTSLFVGLGLEQTFGSMFVRGEVNRVFNKKNVSKINNVNISADSYTFKIGGGYRF